MMASGAALSIEERTSPGGASVLALAGDLELATAGRLTGELDAALRLRPRRVVLDLRRVRLMDSSGAGALIGCRRRCARANARLVVVVEDGPVSRLIRRLGLDSLLDVVEARA